MFSGWCWRWRHFTMGIRNTLWSISNCVVQSTSWIYILKHFEASKKVRQQEAGFGIGQFPRSYSDYISGEPLHYWRSTSGFEVDFIIGDHTAVEVKAKENLSQQDIESLRALTEERKLKRYLCVSLEPRTRKIEEVTILPYKVFLNALWNGEYR